MTSPATKQHANRVSATEPIGGYKKQSMSPCLPCDHPKQFGQTKISPCNPRSLSALGWKLKPMDSWIPTEFLVPSGRFAIPTPPHSSKVAYPKYLVLHIPDAFSEATQQQMLKDWALAKEVCQLVIQQTKCEPTWSGWSEAIHLCQKGSTCRLQL